MTKKMKHRFILYPLLFVLALLIWDQIQFNSWKAEKIFYGKEQVIIDDPKDVHIATLTVYTHDEKAGKALTKKDFTHIRLSQGWTMEKIKAYYQANGDTCDDEDFKGRKYLHCFTAMRRWILYHSLSAIYEHPTDNKDIILLTSIGVIPFAPY